MSSFQTLGILILLSDAFITHFYFMPSVDSYQKKKKTKNKQKMTVLNNSGIWAVATSKDPGWKFSLSPSGI